MKKLFEEDKEFKDFEIQIEGKSIYCHKFILSTCCPYFKSLFSSNMKENQTGE